MSTNLKINAQSIRTELSSYKDKPLDCLFEYIWNSFDANATEVKLSFDVPTEGVGMAQNVKLSDNGDGWDFDDDAITNNFMSSIKQPRVDHTFPKGHYGRGRYSFIWIAERLEIYSKSKKLILNHNTDIHKNDVDVAIQGTEVRFVNITTSFSDTLLSSGLPNSILLEFGWLLLENKNFKIYINDCLLDAESIIKDSVEFNYNSLPEELKSQFENSFYAKIVVWEQKPSEYSKFYFIDESGREIAKHNTGLNKKGDAFWHSVYISSPLFSASSDTMIEDCDKNLELEFDVKRSKRIRKQIIHFLKTKLVEIRKPYLKVQSDLLYKDLQDDNILPNLSQYGIYDEESYGELIKTIYTITPSLFTGKSASDKKFICSTFAGLLSTQDSNIIQVVLEQMQELTEDEKKDLLDILNRTSLANVIKTIKEVDHRLEVIDKLKVLISEYETETLEVKHIQKILDDNFWIFGEQFRLFSSTEGSLKNVLLSYAKEILGIEDPELSTSPTGEVDLFLTKSEWCGECRQRNIIVEIKRASKTLKKAEYDQIEGYMERIKAESICNGENQYWEFYLIGKDYDQHIADKIDSAKNHGEKDRGLCHNVKDGKIKIYVRKWSDILEVEWGNKMRYLKDKLLIESRQPQNNPDEITTQLLS